MGNVAQLNARIQELEKENQQLLIELGEPKNKVMSAEDVEDKLQEAGRNHAHFQSNHKSFASLPLLMYFAFYNSEHI
jgi:hypothetical protein